MKATPEPGSLPRIELNHNTGKPGSIFVLNGTLFDGVTHVNILVNGQSVATNILVEGGSFTILLITSPDAPMGIYRVSVVASSGLAADEVLASTHYTLEADAPLREEQPTGVTEVDVPADIGPTQLQFVYLPLVMR